MVYTVKLKTCNYTILSPALGPLDMLQASAYHKILFKASAYCLLKNTLWQALVGKILQITSSA